MLTAMFLHSKKHVDEPQTFIVGMNAEEKFELTTVAMIGTASNNREQLGILVNAIREQDETTKFVAVGMLLDVSLTDSSGKKSKCAYVCLEDREGNAEDLLFPYHKKLFHGFVLGKPQSKETEPRVFGSKGDELVALVRDKIKSVGAPSKHG
jgi:hypothetical protein